MAGSTVGGHNIQIGSAAGNVTILLEREGYRLEFRLPTPGETAPATVNARRQPSYLLDPQHEVAPYLPRRAEQDLIEAWLASPDLVSLLLVTGPGGQGKTRLAGHVASDCHRTGWLVAQAVELSTQLAAGHVDEQCLTEGQPLLVVVDYAERWRLSALVRLVRSLPLDYPHRRVRVLLLARPRPGLWEDIAAQLDRSGAGLADPVALGEFDVDRVKAFTSAAAAFAERRGVATPAAPPPERLASPEFQSPLSLHRAALAAVCAEDPGEDAPSTPSGLSDFLLRHERRAWQAAGQRTSSPPADVIEQLLVISTLFGPVLGRPAAVGLVRRVRLADGDAAAAGLLNAVERLYPAAGPETAPARGQGGGRESLALMPLRPDRLGEDLVGLHLAHHRATSELLDELLVTGSISGLDDLAARRCLLVLAAAAGRHQAAADTLFGLLRIAPQLVARISAPVLQRVVDDAPDSVAGAVLAALPPYSTELLRPAAALARRAYEALPDDVHPAWRAGNLVALGVRLADAGDVRGALAAAQESAAVWRWLAGIDSAAHQPDLAAALTNLGNALGEVGDVRGALAIARESVDVWRPLADADPAAHLPALGRALSNLAARLGQVGDVRGALAMARESVDVWRPLADADPAAHLPPLTRALTNLAVWLGEVGDVPGALAVAERSVQVCRRLAQVEPAAHLPSLARALANLGILQAQVGADQAAVASAEESVEIGRWLAQVEPAAYLPILADALTNLGLWLADVGAGQAAVAVAKEAVQVRRPLAQVEPAAHLPALAGALTNLATVLSRVGETEAAVSVAREAVEVWRPLAEADVAHRPDLAAALGNLGNRLAGVGDAESALSPAREAVEVWRPLAEVDAAHMPYLAAALTNWGNRLAETDDPHGALAAQEEAAWQAKEPR